VFSIPLKLAVTGAAFFSKEREGYKFLKRDPQKFIKGSRTLLSKTIVLIMDKKRKPGAGFYALSRYKILRKFCPRGLELDRRVKE
jgi:hypothetical protein